MRKKAEIAKKAEPQFHPTQCFEGAWFPRHEDRPDGPQLQSMVKCICGQWWKNHAFVTGACPVTDSEVKL